MKRLKADSVGLESLGFSLNGGSGIQRLRKLTVKALSNAVDTRLQQNLGLLTMFGTIKRIRTNSRARVSDELQVNMADEDLNVTLPRQKGSRMPSR